MTHVCDILPTPCTSRLRVIPVSLSDAKRYVVEVHRHNDPPVGHKFSIGAECESGELHGVAIVGRPVARNADDGETLEVLRLASDGTRNVPSMLYRSAVRAAWALGYRRVITYTLASEPGTSLRAAGWVRDAELDERDGWKHTAGPRALDKPTLFYQPKMPTEAKVRWVLERAA